MTCFLVMLVTNVISMAIGYVIGATQVNEDYEENERTDEAE